MTPETGSWRRGTVMFMGPEPRALVTVFHQQPDLDLGPGHWRDDTDRGDALVDLRKKAPSCGGLQHLSDEAQRHPR